MYRIVLPIVAFFLLTAPHLARPQSAPQPRSVRATALGGATVAIDGGEAFDGNASLVSPDSGRAALLSANFTPSIGGLGSSNQLVATGMTKIAPFGVTLFTGFADYSFEDLYHSTRIAFGITENFELLSDHRASVGIRINYASQSFHGASPTLSAFPVDIGIAFDVTPTVTFGAAAENLLSAGYTIIDGTREVLTKGFSGGFAYHPNRSSMTITAEVQTEEGEPTRERFGAEYWIDQPIAIRLGAASNPSTISGGIGLRYSEFALDAAAEYMPLGTTLTLGLAWEW